jgi:hypothetical protein
LAKTVGSVFSKKAYMCVWELSRATFERVTCARKRTLRSVCHLSYVVRSMTVYVLLMCKFRRIADIGLCDLKVLKSTVLFSNLGDVRTCIFMRISNWIKRCSYSRSL